MVLNNDGIDGPDGPDGIFLGSRLCIPGKRDMIHTSFALCIYTIAHSHQTSYETNTKHIITQSRIRGP